MIDNLEVGLRIVATIGRKINEFLNVARDQRYFTYEIGPRIRANLNLASVDETTTH